MLAFICSERFLYPGVIYGSKAVFDSPDGSEYVRIEVSPDIKVQEGANITGCEVSTFVDTDTQCERFLITELI